MRRSIHFFLTGLVVGCLTITGAVQASDLAQRTEEILSRFQSDDFEEVKMNYCSKLLDKQKVKEAEAYLAKETGGATIGDLYHEIQCFDGSDIWSLIASNPGKYERSYEYLMEELSKAGLLRLTAEGRYKDGRYVIDSGDRYSPISRVRRKIRSKKIPEDVKIALRDFDEAYREYLVDDDTARAKLGR